MKDDTSTDHANGENHDEICNLSGGESGDSPELAPTIDFADLNDKSTSTTCNRAKNRPIGMKSVK